MLAFVFSNLLTINEKVKSLKIRSTKKRYQNFEQIVFQIQNINSLILHKTTSQAKMTSRKNRLVIFIVPLIITLTHSTVLITSPAINPFDQSKIPYSYANIGNIPYGKTLAFDLNQPQTQIDLCGSMQLIQHLTKPQYLLVNSSKLTCSYTTQAINAQQLGARGIVFVSDIVNYYGKVVQVDDGNGRKVHITVLFISTQTYRQLHSIKNVHIKVQYQLYKSQKVNLTYFLSSSGRANYIFLREFQPYYEKIKSYINFQPLYLTIKCPFCVDKQCLISKDYCSFEMDTYADNVGQLILREQLRQWSIWKKFGTDKYLSYMSEFDKFCTASWLQSQTCGNDIMGSINIQRSNLIDATPTGIMDQWRIRELSAGFMSIPEMTINEQLYAGSYDPQEVFQTLCESLIYPPSECTGGQTIKSSSKMGWIIGVIITASIISMILGIYLYKKCVKKQLTKDMFSKVNQLVARYATKVSQHNKKRKDKLKMRLNEEL